MALKGLQIATTSVGWANFGMGITPKHLEFLVKTDVDYVRIYLSQYAWNNVLGYKQKILDIVNYLKANGIIVSVMVANATANDWGSDHLKKSQFIMNDLPELTQNEYIESCKEMVSLLQPDRFQIMGEPPNPGRPEVPYTVQEVFPEYIKFIELTANQLYAIKPNLSLQLESLPFWNPNNLIDWYKLYGLNLDGDYIINFHVYPQDGVATIDTALNNGDYETAKQIYRDYLTKRAFNGGNKSVGNNLDEMRSLGLKAELGEFGTNIFQIEWKERLKIHYDLMKELNLDASQHNYLGNSGDASNYGVLVNRDADVLEFNEVGEAWLKWVWEQDRFLLPVILGGSITVSVILYLLWKK